jgi:hypothetical protein
MVYTVGGVWAGAYLILACILLLVALWIAFGEAQSKGGGLVLLVLGLICFYFGFFAATHFRVGVNERALIINTISGRVEGVRGPGVQPRPILGVRIQYWPANRAYQVFLDLQPGTASASTANNISLWVDTKLFLDLVDMNIEHAYYAVNGDWEVFYSRYLETQLMNLVRATSKDFTVVEHNTRREDWARAFDGRAQAFFASDIEGFGIRIVPDLTTMSWDFVSEDDAQAFDQAQRAAFLITQRQNEQAALNIEAQMAVTRAQILVDTGSGALEAWRQVVDFIALQPPDVQLFLVEYMDLQADLEYLRLVGEQRPDNFFPPGSGGPQAVFSTNPVLVPTPQPQATEQAP